MKKNATILLILLLSISVACKKKKKAAEEEDQITIEMNQEEDSKSEMGDSEVSGDCEDFVDAYEKWMDSYVDLLAKYKENPVSLATSPEYTAMSMEMMEWSSKWSELAIDCARYPEYEERFNKIQEKAEKEMEELGFN